MATRVSACPCSLSGRLSKRDFSVCSSEVIGGTPTAGPPGRRPNRNARRSPAAVRGRAADRKSVVSGKSVSVRVALGGRSIVEDKITDTHARTVERLDYHQDNQTGR